MNLNRILVISFVVLLFSSYETDSSLLFTILMKLLMIKGALFMTMPLSIGAFVMGQGMGFFAGNMMGGYMMLRAANTYHNKEKTKWVQHSHWHGPPYHTNTYQNGYNKGKAIMDAINAGKAKVNAIASIFKPFIPSTSPKYGPPKYRPPPPLKYGPPKGYPHGPSYSDYGYGSYSNLEPAMATGPTQSDLYPPNVPSQGVPGVPLSYEDYYSGKNRKNGFSSVLSSMAGGGSIDEEEKIKRIHTDVPVSPSGFYTSAYGTPGQEFTGILTNEPNTQGDKYLRGEADSLSTASPSSVTESVTTAPNSILESYLEQRLKLEAKKAEKQKDSERKQEAQQLVQMLRKAYLKQLVDSLKEEEVAQKQKSSRKLSTSPFASLSSSIESLFGSRESRSMEQGNNDADGSARKTSQNLIRDLLINEVFTSSTTPMSAEISNKDDNIDTSEVESITERIVALTSTEREELIKGLDEIGQEQEEAVISKPVVSTSTESNESATSSSTENSVAVGTDKKRNQRGTLPLVMAAEWVPVENTFTEENVPFSIRVRRQTGIGAGVEAGASSAGGAAPNSESQKQIQGFVEDIRKFFTLLSALDQDQCLQKLVCDVHTNEKDLTTLTQYEQNILTTFKLMKALMPEGEEDSSTKYRYAAVVGETGQSIELCQQTYSSCSFSSSQIVELGTQQPQEAAGIGLDLASLQQQSQQAAAMAGSASSTTTTAPPTTLRTVKPEDQPAPQTSRRNYVESNQYYESAVRRHQQEPEEFYQESSLPALPQTQQRRPQHHLQQQYHRPIQRPQRYQHQHQPQAQPSTLQQSAEEFREPQNGPPNSFFNYDDFSDYFRATWSDSMMGKKRRMRGFRHRLQPRYPIDEVREEMGI